LQKEKGVDWHGLPTEYKRGQYFCRTKVVRGFTPNELAKLPEKHAARKDPSMQFERTTIEPVTFDYLRDCPNKIEKVFV
jgi:hypothetical protein